MEGNVKRTLRTQKRGREEEPKPGQHVGDDFVAQRSKDGNKRMRHILDDLEGLSRSLSEVQRGKLPANAAHDADLGKTLENIDAKPHHDPLPEDAYPNICTITEFKEPEILTYSPADEQVSASNHFLREVCMSQELIPRFEKPEDNKGFDKPTVCAMLQQLIEHTDAISDFVQEEVTRLIVLLQGEKRADVMSRRATLLGKAYDKLARLERSRSELVMTLEGVEKTCDNEAIPVEFLNEKDRERALVREYQIFRTYGEMPHKETVYLTVDLAWQEPL
ncbi:unnamed protein product [Discula destructiva]